MNFNLDTFEDNIKATIIRGIECLSEMSSDVIDIHLCNLNVEVFDYGKVIIEDGYTVLDWHIMINNYDLDISNDSASLYCNILSAYVMGALNVECSTVSITYEFIKE